MKKSIKTQVNAVEKNNAAEVALWTIVIVLGAFGAYGMYCLLWDVSKVAYVFTAGVFFAVAIATPMMVLRAEKGHGKWQVFAFALAMCLALIDWGAGYNAGIQVERQVMQLEWETGQAAYDLRVTQATDDISKAKTNLQLATDQRMALTLPDTSGMGPQNTAAEIKRYEVAVSSADGLIAIAKLSMRDAEDAFNELPSEYVKPGLVNHAFLGVIMAGLQFITLFGFVVVQRIQRQRVEKIVSLADQIETTIKRRVAARTRKPVVA